MVRLNYQLLDKTHRTAVVGQAVDSARISGDWEIFLKIYDEACGAHVLCSKSICVAETSWEVINSGDQEILAQR